MKNKIGVFLLSFLIFFTVNCEKKIPFPTELIGVWTTESPGYADKYIDIKDMQIIFGTGESIPSILLVDQIQKKTKTQLVEWTLKCKDIEGNPIDIVVFYKIEANKEQITMKNKEQVLWTKVKD